MDFTCKTVIVTGAGEYVQEMLKSRLINRLGQPSDMLMRPCFFCQMNPAGSPGTF